MTLEKRYVSQIQEPALAERWASEGVYAFRTSDDAPVYAIDTPPPSVSGRLHLGHVYSYTHADIFARYRRMCGDNVFYPMGFDDNGLPTERLVERERGLRAVDIGRQAFIRECLKVSEAAERHYEALWRRLGLSIDWHYTYRTIDDESRRAAQWGFLDLLNKGLAYRAQSPTIWCPECRTAISQAELNELDRETTFHTLAFSTAAGESLPIATTRPELLPACVAVFVHPSDERYRPLIGQQAIVPLFDRKVPILADPGADRTKGTGAVMCCTFGDNADIAWWRGYGLPLIEVLDREGRMTAAAHPYEGLMGVEARRRIVTDLQARSLLLDAQPVKQTVRVHERCDTPVEYLTTRQWFVSLLNNRDEFLAAGEKIAWYPEHMKVRYRQWVENLGWDWCISRQRYFGVPFPVWYCANCGEMILADEDDLPVEPTEDKPGRSCSCGSDDFVPETDVMDTWATSSLTPQIVGRMLSEPGLYRQVFPMSLRPQAHEIIRTWVFYTIVRSLYHTGELPWRAVAISGWGLAPDGETKLSKSRGGDPDNAPLKFLEEYSADAVRYWAAGTSLGKDAAINVERIMAGGKWANKLWNVARFSERFLTGYHPPSERPSDLTPADRWLLARLNQVTEVATSNFERFDYASAKSDIEAFFWRDLADNYLEMVKKRLYEGGAGFEAAQYTLYISLLTTIKLLAPIMPYITEAIYLGLFSPTVGESLHRSSWPQPDSQFDEPAALTMGEGLLAIVTAIRRYKSERSMSVGSELAGLRLVSTDPAWAAALDAAESDLLSITRAGRLCIELAKEFPPNSIAGGPVGVYVEE